MKVAEMIAYLQTLDQDAEVYTSNDYWMSAGALDIADDTYGLKYGEVPYSYSESDGPYTGYYLEV